MTAANEKPLPCPFCGGNARVYTDSYTRWQQSVCDGCGAKGPEVMAGCLPDAIAAWNRRTQTADIEWTMAAIVTGPDNKIEAAADAKLHVGDLLYHPVPRARGGK